jgi:hypothetical protein
LLAKQKRIIMVDGELCPEENSKKDGKEAAGTIIRQ